MNKLIFSQSSVYRLHRLAKKVREETGTRHKLSDDSALLNLIRSCTFSENTHIKWLFREFLQSLDNLQLQSLADHGIDLGFKQAS